jgi:hypothetical protein
MADRILEEEMNDLVTTSNPSLRESTRPIFFYHLVLNTIWY